MEIIAKSHYLRVSPRKLRLIAELVRNLEPNMAIAKLKFINKHGVEYFIDVLRQGLGNAKNNFKLDENNLIIKEILVDEGPRLKRMDKSHGARFNRGLKQKRMSHLKIILAEKAVEKKVVKVEKKVVETKTDIKKSTKKVNK